MIYCDTSFFVSLIAPDHRQQQVKAMLADCSEAFSFTSFHEVEMQNALAQKVFRHENTVKDVERALSFFRKLVQQKMLQEAECEYAQVLQIAARLSAEYTQQIGARSLDVIHVAMALELHASEFWTFDAKQAKLAEAVNLRVRCQ